MTLLTTTATPTFPWSTMGQILWFSLLTGVGLVGLFSLGVYALSGARSETASALKRSMNWLLLTLCTGAIVAVLAWGFYLIIHKS